MATQYFNKNDLASMDSRHRVHFINSLSGFKSANLIGTIDKLGVTNLSIVSSVVHLGADPALIAFVSRPQSVERNTLDNIDTIGDYTINHVPADYFKDAHHTSARYPADVSEFDQTNFTEMYTQLKAPYVEQSNIKMGVKLRQKIDIQLNGTVFVIGEIVEVIIKNDIILDDGKIDIEQAQSVAVSGLDEYHTTQSLGRLAYAKPKK